MSEYTFRGKSGAVFFNASTLEQCCGVAEVTIYNAVTAKNKTRKELHKEFLLALTGNKETTFLQMDGDETEKMLKEEEMSLRVRMFLLTDIESGDITKFCEDCGLVPTSTTVNPKTKNTISIWLIESDW